MLNEIASFATVTAFLLPLAVLFWRIEHRLTKIETELIWIKNQLHNLERKV